MLSYETASRLAVLLRGSFFFSFLNSGHELAYYEKLNKLLFLDCKVSYPLLLDYYIMHRHHASNWTNIESSGDVLTGYSLEMMLTLILCKTHVKENLNV